MSFSIICQYVTNTVITNATTRAVEQVPHVLTVLLDTATIIKAMVIDIFWTNNSTVFQSNLVKWQPSALVYEENMTTGYQGIFLRRGNEQLNVSPFFTNNFAPPTLSTNSYADMFAVDVADVFGGTNYALFSTNSYVDVYAQDATNAYAATNFASNSLPLVGTYGYDNGPVGIAYDNLTYLKFSSSNTSFTLFGYSEGMLVNAVYDAEGHVGKVDMAHIIGAGTFSLNLTTNFLRVTPDFPYIINGQLHTVTNLETNNVVLAENFAGLAHGTVIVSAPYHLNIGIGPSPADEEQPTTP